MSVTRDLVIALLGLDPATPTDPASGEIQLTIAADWIEADALINQAIDVSDDPVLIDGASGAGDILEFSSASHAAFLATGATEGQPSVQLFADFSSGQTTYDWVANVLRAQTTAQAEFKAPTGIHFTNFEQIVGSSFDDVFDLQSIYQGHGAPSEQESAARNAARQASWELGDTPAAIQAKIDAAIDAVRAVGVDAPVSTDANGNTVVGSDYTLTVDGGAGRDTIIGSDIGRSVLYGGAGVDYLYAGEFVSELHGGADTDYLVARGLKTQMYGGADGDWFGLANGAFVMDATAQDVATWGPFQLTGAVQQWWQESSWAMNAPFLSLVMASPFAAMFNAIASSPLIYLDAVKLKTARYGMSDTGQLIIQQARGRAGQAVIENWSQNSDAEDGEFAANIAVFRQEVVHEKGARADFEHYVNLALKAGFGRGLYGTDPLILDLDGDGIELTRRDAGLVYFDIDADGFGERTSWVQRDDGLLARDLNGNGTIDDITELFGDEATPGFTALAALDSNGDGMISAADAAFGELLIWQDTDQDGVSDAGELATLADHAIATISLATTAPAETILRDSEVRAESVYTRTDGTLSAIADVVLMNSQTDSRLLGDFFVSSAAATLPELKGSGDLASLRVAMSADATLLSLVAALDANTGIASWQGLRTATADILYRWAGVDGIAATPVTDALNERQLAYLETALGYELTPRDAQGNLDLANASELAATWNEILNIQTARLAVQGPLKSTFAAVSYDVASDRFTSSDAAALTTTIGAVIAQLPSDPVVAETVWAALWAPALTALTQSMIRADGIEVRSDYIVQALVAATDTAAGPLSLAQYVGGLDLGEVKLGTAGDDALARTEDGALTVYVGGAGNDTLTGGAGQDVYVFDTGFGVDTIFDEELNGRQSGDRLRLATLTQDDVTIARNGEDLVVSVNGTSDKVIVKSYYATPVVLPSGYQLTPNFGIEDIQFADGAILEAGEIAGAVGLGTSGGDVLTGTALADELEGLEGDDTLRGGDGGDLYFYTIGDGNDVIEDVMTDIYLTDADTLFILGGVEAGDLTFTRDGAGDDLTISFGDLGGSILIKDQFAYGPLGFQSAYATDNRIEAVFFQWGTPLDWLGVQAETIAAYTSDGDDITYGFGTPDEFQVSAGNDYLSGLDGSDTYRFGIGSGQDVIEDASRYVKTPFAPYVGGSDSPDDTLVFGSGITAADITFTRPIGTTDLMITIAGHSDTMTIKGQFDGIKLDALGFFDIAWFDRVETLKFEDGTVLTWEDVLADITTGTSSDDTLVGAYYADTLDGKGGNDTLSGGDDGDTYIFGRGYGADTVDDNQVNVLTTAPDTILFASGITVSDVSFARDGRTDDLLITITDTGDTLRIYGQYTVTETGPFGAQAFDRIERFEWSDGTLKTWDALSAEIISAAATAGDDLILGTHFDDTLTGGNGNDTLEGGNGADTYVFAQGNGDDTIFDNHSNILARDGDSVAFAAGVTAATLALTRSGTQLQDLVVTLDTGDTLTIKDQFTTNVLGHLPNQIETFTFADGTTWSAEDIRETAITQATSAGNDIIDGFWSNDDINGGAGDDVLRGHDGADTYTFQIGFGHDTIEESVSFVTLSDEDAIVFGAGLNAADAALTRSGNDLVISFAGSSDTVTVRDQFAAAAYYGSWTDIEEVRFADGTAWSAADLRATLLTNAATTGDDVIDGLYTADVIDGGAGNDLLRGSSGSDTYIFGLGSGQDVIEERLDHHPFTAGVDTVSFAAGIALSDISFTRTGDDLVITVSGASDTLTIRNHYADANAKVENFTFADGTTLTADQVETGAIAGAATAGADTITGSSANNVLAGGAGNDVLDGADGSDTYVFNRGDGQDTITETAGAGDNGDEDVLALGPGIARTDLSFARTGATGRDLTIAIAGTSDTITITDQFASFAYYGAYADIERIVLADGSSITDADIRTNLIAASSTAGDDTVEGFFTDDVIDGGAGNDELHGSTGSDTYIFGRGSGQDTVVEALNDHPFLAGTDTVAFAVGLTAADVAFSRTGDDLLIEIADTSDELRITNHFVDEFAKVEEFRFADDTVFTSEEVEHAALQAQFTTGNDTITGTGAAEVFSAGAGDDIINGGDGDDTYLFQIGDGQDRIVEYGSADGDTLSFGAGIAADDIVLSRSADLQDLTLAIAGTSDAVTIAGQFTSFAWYGSWTDIEIVNFADGTVWTYDDILARLLADARTGGDDHINGFYTADVIDGGAGDDILRGSSGADTYVFDIGYDHDTIAESLDDHPFLDNPDTVLFGQSVIEADTLFARDGDDLIITFAASDDTLRVAGQFASEFTRVENFQYTSGTLLGQTDVQARVLLDTRTLGDDALIGLENADTLDGLAGNDLLIGNGGSDTYLFGRDYGSDTIDDNGNSDGDTVRFKTGIAQADLTWEADGNDLIVTVGGAPNDQLRIVGQFNASGPNRIEAFLLSDRTVLTHEDVTGLLNASGIEVTISGTPGNDTIYGTADDDIIAAGLGNDAIDGAGGGNTYVYTAGDGNDNIYEDDNRWGYGAPGLDRLVLTDLNATDVELTHSGTKLLIDILSTGEQINFNWQYWNTAYNYGVDEIEFADGTIWDRATIDANAWIRGTENSETLIGINGDITYQGKGGNDTIATGQGRNTFVYSAGDGNDTLKEDAGTAIGTDRLVFTDLNETDVALRQSGHYMYIDIATTGETITVFWQYWSDAATHGLDEIEFASGNVWDRGEINENAWWLGTAAANTINASNRDDSVDGFAGNDVLNGGNGNDILLGNTGDDQLTGGAGNDSFIFRAGDGNDTITDFDANGDDTIVFSGGVLSDFAAVQAAMSEVAGNVVITIDAANSATVTGKTIAQLTQDDFAFA